ncbi:protein MRVI1-like [Scleropages formosus]|uniref:Protein MRVI1-like n=1 Tax=Scleropages formosus TaxID=113540 RepID=A0A0P7YTE8_SCLFO|nr:protein MRVI1-like [Scleropages formosus]
MQKVWRTEVEGQLARALQQAQEAKKMAVINWWKALKVEENKAKATEEVFQVSQAHLVTADRLQTAEGTVQELHEQSHHLEGALRNSQQKRAEYRSFVGSDVCKHTENVDVYVGEGHQEHMVKREEKDAAVATDPEGETQTSITEGASDPATETLMVSVRRAEHLTRWAQEAAQLACLNERGFSEAKTRMDTAIQRMEQALLGAAEAEAQLTRLEACISVKAQPMNHSWLSGPGMSSLASSECTRAEKSRISSAEELVGPASESSGCLSVNGMTEYPSVREEDTSISSVSAIRFPCIPRLHPVISKRGKNCGRVLRSPDFHISNVGKQASSYVRGKGDVEQCGYCSGHSPGDQAATFRTAETSPLNPEENPAGLTAPPSEDNSVGISSKSPGPPPASRSQHGNKHVEGQEISVQSDTYQSESPDDGRSQTVGSHLLTLTDSAKAEEDHHSQHIPTARSCSHPKETTVTPSPRFRSRCPTMPTLPEEEEDSPEELDSSSSSPVSYTPAESHVVNTVLPTPSIVIPGQANTDNQVPKPLKQTSAGHVIDLVKDTLPEVQLSEEDKKKNLELLEEAKKVSDRFLTRRGRRSTCSLSDSPTEATDVTYASPSANQHLEVPGVKEQGDSSTKDPENSRKVVDWKATEKRKVSSGTLSPRYSPKESRDPQQGGERGKKGPMASAERVGEGSTTRGSQRIEPPTTSVAKPVPRPAAQQAPCTAEIKTIGAFPPLMRAVSWDTAGCAAPNFSRKGEEACFPFEPSATDSPLKSSGYKDFPVQPVKMQKLTKIREEHKLIRNQSIVGSKLPDLSETAEQDRASPMEEECKEKLDVMPSISDVMLRKLKLHRALPGNAPSLTEKEVENAFVQLSLAFRNDSYTLEMRLRHAERDRNLTEENAEKELEEFKGCLKGSVMLWQNLEQRETYQRLLETVDVLHRLATRLSSRAEMVGAVRQEKRMNKATEVMMQYVENLKRTYEKDHAELMEFKKLANQNSSRCYGGSMDNGDDGVPRSSRSMSLTLGKALPRRRVSVAVVPKFNLLNIPGQSPSNSGQGLPVLCETNSMRSSPPNEPTQQAGTENGRTPADQEGETSALTKPSAPINNNEIISELKAKIEEEAYNKGSKYEEALDILERMCPKIFKQNRLLWIVLTLLGVAFFIVSLFTYFSDRYSERGDASTGKSVGPGKKKFFGWNVKNPTPD